ncbi:MAG: carboxy terminal-processing peptidase [Bacteriovoracaceae bacterium]|jgi:carboxyl-terminal processing protease|nr:tail-specific protease [Halobacteriovoraceae bacterium]MDP7320479.1 carboxy terminal-processing peptidase [Bacteriovoracaceae bacterium]
MKLLLLFCTLTLCGASACAAKEKVSQLDEKKLKQSSPLGAITERITPQIDKNVVVGGILEKVLENLHYLHKKVNDDLSEKAFKLYLERVDYGKQFFTEDDVEKLEEQEKKFDDQLKVGDLSIVKITQKIMTKRVPMIEKHVEKLLKKDFDYTKNETYETDAEKRDFVDDEDELKERWRKLVKLEVLMKYFELKDEQDGIGQEDKEDKKKKTAKKSKKKEKKKTYKELMKEAREKIAKRYHRVFKRLQEERQSDRLDKFYNAITRVYDPHTVYLMPEDKEDFDIDMSGKLEGIGALLREEGSFIKVERIIPGSASWRGKELQAEDTILAVGQEDEDPVDIVDMSIRDAVKLIRGPKGTTVILKVRRPDGTTKVISIVRDQVVLEEAYVKSTIIEHKDLKQKIGYIHVPKFYRDFQDPNGRNSSEDVKREIIKLKKQGVDGIVLNLRNNGGGALVDATLMGGLFIDEGPIVQVKNRGAAKVHEDTDGKTYWDKPLVVLINRFSASASEIVAGALKDYDRAVVVGTSEQTHGKGTVQAIVNLTDYINPIYARLIGPIGAMKITTDMFYRINGMSTQFRGIKPHIVLPDEYGYLDTGERSLDFAIPYREIKSTDFEKWKKTKYNISKLKVNSEKRVKKDKRFQKIVKSVNWSKERKNDSKRTITLKAMDAYRKEAREVSEKYKLDDINENVLVKSTQKLKTDVDKDNFKEFKEELQKDPVIEETLFIFNDILKS